MTPSHVRKRGIKYPIAAIIEEPSSKQGLGLHPCGLVIIQLFAQLGLDRLEQVPVDDGRLLPGQNLALEYHLPNVEPVAEQVGKRTARERDVADCRSRLQGADLGHDALLTFNWTGFLEATTVNQASVCNCCRK
jgi:hypothetical protein